MKSRKTYQKAFLQSEIGTLEGFFSAEALFEKAAKRDKSLGIATVYRFLREAVSSGRLHSYSCERRTVYSSTERAHGHFVCKVCGKSGHFSLKNLDFAKKESDLAEICHLQVDVTGTCKECARGKDFRKNAFRFP